MRKIFLVSFLLSNVFLYAGDSTAYRLQSHDSIIIRFEQLEKILQVNDKNKFDLLELVKLFAPAIAGGITALIALIGISKQIRNSQNLQRIDFIEKKKHSLISTHSDLIYELEKEGEIGLLNIMKQKPPNYYFAKKETELKLLISLYIQNRNDYLAFFEVLNFYKKQNISTKLEVYEWLNSVEGEFKKIITKI
ncbi:hypothetical protein [Ferruginibacter sp.]